MSFLCPLPGHLLVDNNQKSQSCLHLSSVFYKYWLNPPHLPKLSHSLTKQPQLTLVFWGGPSSRPSFLELQTAAPELPSDPRTLPSVNLRPQPSIYDEDWKIYKVKYSVSVEIYILLTTTRNQKKNPNIIWTSSHKHHGFYHNFSGLSFGVKYFNTSWEYLLPYEVEVLQQN